MKRVAAVKVSHANRQLEQKAYIDLHTGLPNKSKCEELFHNVEFIKTPTACIVFDMNNLKRVNDSLGHSIGDQLILNFARLLRNSIPAKHFVGRYGGDEFMAVIYDATRESITEILTEFQNEVEQFNRLRNPVPHQLFPRLGTFHRLQRMYAPHAV